MADLFEIDLEPEFLSPDYEEAQESVDDLAAYCRDLYEECRTSEYRERKLTTERDRNRKKYRGDRDPKTKPWKGCSNKSLMIDAIVIDNLEPRLMAQLFGDSDFVHLEPVGEEDAATLAQAQAQASWLLTVNAQIEEQMKPVIHDMMLDGTAIIIPIWHEEENLNMVRVPVPQFMSPNGLVQLSPEEAQHPTVQALIQQGAIQFAGMGEKIEWKRSSKFRVNIEQCQLHDCYFPDTGDDWDTQPFMRMIYPLYHELEEMSEENGGPYVNIDRDLIYGQSRSGMDDHDTDETAIGVTHSEHLDECPLLECHIPWEGDWILVTFAPFAGWREVRRQPMHEVYAHGRKAPRRLSIFRESNESMGTGFPWKIRHFSDGCDDLYNQMIDNGTLQNMPWYAITETPGGFDRDQQIMPGKGIVLPKGSDISFPTFGGNAERFISFIELLLQMQERLVSMMAYTQTGQINQGSAGSETYAGMSLLVNEGNIKHNYTGQGLRNEVSKLVKDILSLYGQYIPFDAKMRIFENEEYVFKPFDLQALQAEYDVKINVSSSSGNKMLQRQEAQELYGALGHRPEANGVWLVNRLLESYDVKDTKEAIRPEVNQLIQMFMADPDVLPAMQQFMQQKQEQMRQQEIQGQAMANLERQQAQRQAEMPVEDQKIIDQAREGAKRQLVKPIMEQEIAAQAMAGQL